MHLRFFIDHCIPNFVIKTLQDADYEVFKLKDYVPDIHIGWIMDNRNTFPPF